LIRPLQHIIDIQSIQTGTGTCQKLTYRLLVRLAPRNCSTHGGCCSHAHVRTARYLSDSSTVAKSPKFTLQIHAPTSTHVPASLSGSIYEPRQPVGMHCPGSMLGSIHTRQHRMLRFSQHTKYQYTPLRCSFRAPRRNCIAWPIF